MNVVPKGLPGVMITDQESTMTKAIAKVLPLTIHHYCIWHPSNKFSKKLGAIIYYDNYNLLKNVIMYSEIEKEFEASWFDLWLTTKFEKNAWLNQLLKIRNKWVSA